MPKPFWNHLDHLRCFGCTVRSPVFILKNCWAPGWGPSRRRKKSSRRWGDQTFQTWKNIHWLHEKYWKFWVFEKNAGLWHFAKKKSRMKWKQTSTDVHWWNWCSIVFKRSFKMCGIRLKKGLSLLLKECGATSESKLQWSWNHVAAFAKMSFNYFSCCIINSGVPWGMCSKMQLVQQWALTSSFEHSFGP